MEFGEGSRAFAAPVPHMPLMPMRSRKKGMVQVMRGPVTLSQQVVLAAQAGLKKAGQAGGRAHIQKVVAWCRGRR